MNIISIVKQKQQAAGDKKWRDKLKKHGFIRKTVVVHEQDWLEGYNFCLELRRNRIEALKERGEL